MVKKSSVLRFFQILGVPNLDTVSKIRPTTNQILIISELLINEHKVPQDGLRSIFSKSIKKGVFNLVKFTFGQTLRYIVTSYLRSIGIQFYTMFIIKVVFDSP